MFQESKELTITTAPRTGKWRALAEAIRMGSALIPRQEFGGRFYETETACALGAAAFYLNIDPYNLLNNSPEAKAPNCPIRSNCNLLPPWIHGTFAVIPHLNDDHRWTRERIADWLDQL